MKRIFACIVAIAIFAMGLVYAAYSVGEKGEWPASWPKELEPLRKQAQTYVGPTWEAQHFVIPFTSRAEFEAAWPHILEVKTKGATLFLLRSGKTWIGLPLKAGVVVHCPPVTNNKQVNPEEHIPGIPDSSPREGRLNTTYIDLTVDGNIVDLNRIPLPPNTPIIDARFTAAQAK